ncbi:MAG TPA: thioesterase family protein [Hyphomicrobiaceae bacterium]|nr:thioesterase family protein [Hyphomicrobiaceae bacterium]
MTNQRRPPADRRAFYHFLSIPTRWMDNDVYGHVNNAVYYVYFDTVINRYLIEAGGLNFRSGPVVGIAVETMCRFHRSFSYPEIVEAGLRVGRLGTSSVRYEVGLFGPREEEARADGHFVHVFVERGSMRPVPIPDPIRLALAKLSN